MQKILTLAIFTLFLTGISFGQKSSNSKVIAAKELRNDIDTLIKYIEETHPNAFYKFTKDQFIKEADGIKSIITRPLSIYDFYLLTAPLVAKLQDGHTSIQFPQMEYFNENPILFPYNVKLSSEEPFITIVRPFRTMPADIPDNAEVLTINDFDSKKIVKDIIKLNSGESDNFRADMGANFFYFYLNTLYGGLTDYFTVKYKTDEKTERKKINGIKYDSLVKRQSQDTTKAAKISHDDYSLKLMPETKTAIIDFESFNDMQKFKIFINSAFEQIQTNKIENLIIDIRENRGGNSAIGDEFFQYISPVPFNQYPKAKIKYSALQKETYRMRYEKTKDRSWRATRKKPNGLVEDITSSSIKLRRNPLRFKGKVYLLTGISTFSSAGSFAQCFKYYKMGKIIGEETGGWIIHYGDVINASLPNSKLGLTISHKMWFEAGAQENDFHGTAPDIKVAAEKAMEYTLELIKKQ